MNTRRNSPWLALGILAAIATVGFVDRIVVNVLVEPIKLEFGLTDTQVSMLTWAFAALNVLGGFVTARFAERVRRLTLIAGGVTIWSVFTAACGLAGSWGQLLTARMGVGLGEAIGLPPNQSVISDYFPANRRGLAISILLLSPPLGAFIGFVGGGYVAQTYSWEATFLVAAIPGFVLGIAAYIFVAEPPRGQFDAEKSDDVPPISAFFERMWSLPSARYLVFGSFIAAALSYALNFFFASLLVRKFGMGLAEAGLYTGVLASLPAALSIVGAGWLGDRLGERNPAAYALIPGIGLAIGGPLGAFGVLQDDLTMLLICVGLSIFFTLSYLGITFATVQNLMHPRMRATASATLNGIYTLAGGVGPTLVALLSDALLADYGEAQSLALAMAAGGAFYVLAALFYFLAARHLRADTAKVRATA
ncbi:spinster family MFS transporter [Erythrobacter sp. EC-HK427]|uniref:spinster family MFS transporter n=1 Tax=Erythrobacter sp. EC-HK427 TaxID=2038396 RepID=UPI00125408B3|nr:MFS transporter [Erythrobacter sp. EC-HK427]VVT05229.1 Major facilitator family transporter [Erythrobacter sp. EC-HK427]